jgi:hypothetical protein
MQRGGRYGRPQGCPVESDTACLGDANLRFLHNLLRLKVLETKLLAT